MRLGIKDQGNGDYGSFVAAGWEPATTARAGFRLVHYTDYLGRPAGVVSALTYLIEIDYDPGYGTSFLLV